MCMSNLIKLTITLQSSPIVIQVNYRLLQYSLKKQYRLKSYRFVNEKIYLINILFECSFVGNGKISILLSPMLKDRDVALW